MGIRSVSDNQGKMKVCGDNVPSAGCIPPETAFHRHPPPIFIIAPPFTASANPTYIVLLCGQPIRVNDQTNRRIDLHGKIIGISGVVHALSH